MKNVTKTKAEIVETYTKLLESDYSRKTMATSIRESIKGRWDGFKLTDKNLIGKAESFVERIEALGKTEGKTSREIKKTEETFSNYDEPITIYDVEVLRSIGRKSINQFTSEEIKKAQKWAYKFYKELGVKSPFFRAWFGEWRSYDKTPIVKVDIDRNATINSGNAINDDTKRKFSWSKDAAKESILNAPKEHKEEIAIVAANLSRIVENSILLDTVVSNNTSNRKLPGTAWMHSLYSIVRLDGKVSLIKLFAEEAFSEKQNESFTRAYSLKYIEKVAEFDDGVLSNKGGLTDSHSATIKSISDLYDFVKTHDKEFTPAPEVNKLMLERGRPKVFYHGTKAAFAIFDKSKLDDTLGFYFTEDVREARDYGEAYGYYLNVRNPIDIYSDEYFKKYYGIKNVDERVTVLKADGYDGIASYSHGTQWIIAFEPTQIKSATDNIGTFSKGEANVHFSRELDAVDYMDAEFGEEGRQIEAIQPMSNRELLANALESAAQTDAEKKKLAEYKKNIKRLNAESVILELILATGIKYDSRECWNKYNTSTNIYCFTNTYN